MTETKPAIEISMGMIEKIIEDWKRENPGREVSEMTPTEFADRMMRAGRIISDDD